MKAGLCGLMAAQALSLLHVYLSNIRYYEKLAVIAGAGYLTVPNAQAMERLKWFDSAFYGGLFFTLTVGFSLSLGAIIAAWGWDRLLKRDRRFILSIVIFWLGCTVLVNSEGISLLASSYFLLIPPLVFGLTLRWMPAAGDRWGGLKICVHILCLTALVFIGKNYVNATGFSIIRDHFLLTHPFGIRLNNAYYDYTLYAAQAFKPPAQDLMRTCALSSVGPVSLSRRVERTLLSLGYLPVRDANVADLEISKVQDQLVFKHRGKSVLETTYPAFKRRPAKILKSFSRKCDRHGLFRQFTFVSLLISGLSIYLMLWLPFRVLFGLFSGKALASVLSALTCLAAGGALLFYFQDRKPPDFNRQALKQALVSPDVGQRIEALKHIRRKGLNIARFNVHQQMAKSPHVTERYWLVKALGTSRSPSAYGTLLLLLDDPQVNVAYTAFAFLGRRGDGKAVGEILRRIPQSDSWYVQMYAYKALKRLGWKQAASE